MKMTCHFSEVCNEVTEDRVKNILNDVEIFQFYFDEIKLGKKFSAPYRRDSSPSFVFYLTRHGELRFRDYGITQARGDAIEFVALMFDTSTTNACEKVWDELVLNPNYVPKKIKLVSDAQGIKATWRRKPYQQYELDYWYEIGVNEALLRYFNVYALKFLAFDDRIAWESFPSSPAYCYDFGVNRFKVYRPLDVDNDKFRGINNGKVIEGYDQLPPAGDHLIIHSALKETIAFRRAGYLGCNSSSESNINILLKKLPELKQRFPQIFVIFDLDKTGLSRAEELYYRSNRVCKPIMLPKRFKEGRLLKDSTDIIRNTGNYFTVLDCLPRNLSRYGY